MRLFLIKTLSSAEYHMTQPAEIFMQDNRTKMGIPFFWMTVKPDSPWQFNVWLEQF